MARTSLTPTLVPGGSDGVAFQQFTFVACDPVNGNQFACSGKDIVVARNVNASSPAVSRKLTLYKTNGQIQYYIPAGGYVYSGVIPTTGFSQSGTVVWVDRS